MVYQRPRERAPGSTVPFVEIKGGLAARATGIKHVAGCFPVLPGGAIRLGSCHTVRIVQRHRPNVLFVHFNDLKADLSGEMRRIADFLGIVVPEDMWQELVSMADFDAMRRDGDTLMAAVASLFQGGSQRFFFNGTNERWRGIFRDEDLELYDKTVQAMLPPECAKWVASGRLESGDPA